MDIKKTGSMKRILSMMLSFVLVVGLCGNLSLSVQAEDSESIYGNGVSIAPTLCQYGTYATEEKTIQEGDDAGKKYTRITKSTDIAIFNLTLAVNSNAGLKENSEYKVTVDVTCDGSFFHNVTTGTKEFNLNSSGGSITFIATTDENGVFSKVWTDVWMNGGTYVDITNITIELNEMVYGKGVSISPSKLTLGAYELTEKALSSGEMTGYKYTSIKNTSTRDDKISIVDLTITATEEAELKAGIDYLVTVDVVCDGTEGKWSFYQQDNEFLLKNPGGEIPSFVIATDSNGILTKTWSNIWMANGLSYVDFTGIDIGLLGDANENDDLDVIDIICMKKLASNNEVSSTVNADYADINRTGGITEDDITLLRQKLVKWE